MRCFVIALVLIVSGTPLSARAQETVAPDATMAFGSPSARRVILVPKKGRHIASAIQIAPNLSGLRSLDRKTGGPPYVANVNVGLESLEATVLRLRESKTFTTVVPDLLLYQGSPPPPDVQTQSELFLYQSSPLPPLVGINSGPPWFLLPIENVIAGTQHGYHNQPHAWHFRSAGTGQVAVILSSGIDYLHPDLSPNVWTNDLEIPDNNIDDDQNGWTDDYYGVNCACNNGDPMDDSSSGHWGTMNAGSIAAVGNANGTSSAAGVMWSGVKVMGLKTCSGFNGVCAVSAIIECINYAMDIADRDGTNIVSMNADWPTLLGKNTEIPLLQPLTDKLGEASSSPYDFTIVTPAGNHGVNGRNIDDPNSTLTVYPAWLPLTNMVVVTGSTPGDSWGNIVFRGNWGSTSVDMAAHNQTRSTLIGGGYGWQPAPEILPNTIYSAGHVAGALSVLAAHYPALTPAERIQRLYDRSEKLEHWVAAGRTVTSKKLSFTRLLCDNWTSGCVICGDVDRTWTVTATDALRINRCILNYDGCVNGEMPWGNLLYSSGATRYINHCDVVGTNGKCTGSDSLFINQFVSGQQSSIPQICRVTQDGT